MENVTSLPDTPILALPNELIIQILQFLPFEFTSKAICCVCKKLYELSKDPKLIPRSFTLPLFRSSCREKNVRCREQIMDIVARASLLKTLSIEVSSGCDLNTELQIIGNGRCKVKIDNRASCINNVAYYCDIKADVSLFWGIHPYSISEIKNVGNPWDKCNSIKQQNTHK